MRRVALGALVFAVAVGLAACDIQTGEGHGFSLDLASGKAEDTWTRSYKVGEGARFELVNVNGRIDVESASGTSIELEGRRIAKALSDDAAKDLLSKIEMSEEASDTRVRVEVRAPHQLRMAGQEVRWTVRVPRGVSVDLKTINGGIHLNGVENVVLARTTNGGVTGKRLMTSSVEASAVNGGIDIELAKGLAADGHIDLDTVNGGVTLSLPETSRASINARAVNGGVRVTDLDIVQQGEPNRRRLEGTMNGGGAKVSLGTTNGGIRVTRSHEGQRPES
jgi:hypothetical protein